MSTVQFTGVKKGYVDREISGVKSKIDDVVVVNKTPSSNTKVAITTSVGETEIPTMVEFNALSSDVSDITEGLHSKVGWAKVTGSTLYLYADKAMQKLIQTVSLPSGGTGGGSADGNTTYTFSIDGNVITITDSNGAKQTITLPSSESGKSAIRYYTNGSQVSRVRDNYSSSNLVAASEIEEKIEAGSNVEILTQDSYNEFVYRYVGQDEDVVIFEAYANNIIQRIFVDSRTNYPDYLFKSTKMLTREGLVMDIENGDYTNFDYPSIKAMKDYVSPLKEDLNDIREQIGQGGSGTGTGGSGESVPTFLRGLKYVAIGDSIVELQGTKANPKKFGDFNMLKDLQNRDISNVTVSGYVGAIEEKYGLVCDNQGKSGHTLIQDYANLIAINYSDVALVTISYGCNDARLGNPLGTVNSSDISTYAGALNGLIKKIYEDNPECRIIVLSAIQRLRVSDFGIADANANGNYLVDFVDMARKVAEKRGCYFLDMYRGCGINQTNLPFYTVEGVHPVNFGFKRMSALVMDEMRKITSVEFNPIGVMTNAGADVDTPETGGGSDTPDVPPADEPTATEVEVSSLLTKDGYVYDGWANDVMGRGSYKGIEVGQFIYLEPDKTYTLTTYRDTNGADSRIASVSTDESATGGGNYLHGSTSSNADWQITDAGNGAYKWVLVFSTADSALPKRGTTVCRYLSFGCLNGWTDKAKLSYV